MDKILFNSSLGYPYKNNIFSFDLWTKSLCFTEKLYDNSPLCLHRNSNSINTVHWNNNGSILLTGGDSLQLQLWSGLSNNIIGRINTSHRHNIFDAKFVPFSNDSQVISCAADGRVLLYHLDSYSMESEIELALLPSMAVKYQFIPQNPSTFLITSHSGSVWLIDSREANSGRIVYKQPQSNCLSVAFDPLNPSIFALSTSDPHVGLFDIRNISERTYSSTYGSIVNLCPEELYGAQSYSSRSQYCPTDLIFSSNHELAVNYSSYDVVLFDLDKNNINDYGYSFNIKQRYSERRNRDTFIKDIRFFNNDKYILTGSDSGELFIWETQSGALSRKIKADEMIVNAIAINPVFPKIACSGIDASVKIIESIITNDLDNTKELTNISKPFSSSQMLTVQEAKKSLKKAKDLRLQGNEEYKNKNYQTALSMYKEAKTYLDYIPPGLQYYPKQEEAKKLIYLNLAAIGVILKQWKDVISDCSIVISIDSDNIKARYRRATAYFNLQYYRECQRDLQYALNIAPNDKQLQSLWNKLSKIPKDKKEKKLFEGIFL